LAKQSHANCVRVCCGVVFVWNGNCESYLQQIGVASSVTYTMPIVAIFWGVIAGEKLSFYQILGGFVILLGVYLVNKNKK